MTPSEERILELALEEIFIEAPAGRTVLPARPRPFLGLVAVAAIVLLVGSWGLWKATRPQVPDLASGRDRIAELLRIVETDPDVRARVAALQALGAMKAREASPVAQASLKNPFLAEFAVVTLADIGAIDAWPALVPLLDQEEGLAGLAARALGRLGATPALPALRAHLHSEEAFALQAGVLQALALLGDRPSLPEIRPFLDHPRSNLRRAAVEAVGALGGPADLPLVLARFDDFEPAVQTAALHALTQLLPSLTPDVISGLLGHAWDEVREAAAESLASRPGIDAETLRRAGLELCAKNLRTHWKERHELPMTKCPASGSSTPRYWGPRSGVKPLGDEVAALCDDEAHGPDAILLTAAGEALIRSRQDPVVEKARASFTR